jgi:hypothetical protein
MQQSAETQIAIDHLHVADPQVADPQVADPHAADSRADDPQVADPQPPSTLGQTPHEPTVRPWELELLISGALVFSMIKLPGVVDAWFYGVSPRLDMGWYMTAFMAWYYLKLALYALVGGFVLHLCVRGYWVGVIGLEAVFPNGIRWERMRSGPILREMARERTPSLQTLIDRADRLASMVFGAAFAIALLFGYSLLVMAVLGVAGYAFSKLVLNGARPDLLAMELVLLVFVAPMLVAGLIDRYRGDRLDPDGRTARVIRRVGAFYSRFQTIALFPPLLFTLTTNLGEKRHGRMVAAVMVAFIGFLLVKDVLLTRGVLSADGYTYIPDEPGALAVQPGFYADRAGGSPSHASLPQIQSDIVRDPYVRLFIPYRPRRHNDLIARRCRGVAPNASGELAGAAALECLASLQPVTLNGKPLQTPWRFYTQPNTGIRGIMTYIPTTGLPKGENVLTVSLLPQLEPSRAQAKPRPPFSIPFWL